MALDSLTSPVLRELKSCYKNCTESLGFSLVWSFCYFSSPHFFLKMCVHFYVYFHVAKYMHVLSSASGCQKTPDLCNLKDILLTWVLGTKPGLCTT